MPRQEAPTPFLKPALKSALSVLTASTLAFVGFKRVSHPNSPSRVPAHEPVQIPDAAVTEAVASAKVEEPVPHIAPDPVDEIVAEPVVADNAYTEDLAEDLLGPTSTTTIYTIGDLHGDVECARFWVTATGLISNLAAPSHEWTWSSPSTKLIFVGDYIDKGPTSYHAITFVQQLVARFPSHVHATMGNHEFETLLDRMPPNERNRYYYQLPYATVHPDEYLNWMPAGSVTANTTLALDTLYDLSLTEVYGKNKFRSYDLSPYGEKSVTQLIANETVKEITQTELEKMQKWYIQGFESGTAGERWGRPRTASAPFVSAPTCELLTYLPFPLSVPPSAFVHTVFAAVGDFTEQRDILVVVENMIFLHGGINPKIFAVSGGPTDLAGLVALNDAWKRNARSDLAGAFMRTLQGQIVYDLLTYRGNHKSCEEVEGILNLLEVDKIVVGHTPDDDVRVMCGEKFVAADSALGRWIRSNGNQYCRGTARQVSGRFACEKINEKCEGQILKLTKNGESGEWTPEKVFAE